MTIKNFTYLCCNSFNIDFADVTNQLYNCYRVQCSQEQLPLKTSHQIPTIELHSGDEDDLFDDVNEGDVDKE